MPQPMAVDAVQFIAELYPRLTPSDDVIARYIDAIDKLPPIAIARGGVLVDGYHRWQAFKRTGRDTIQAIDLGDLSDGQILRESYRRNSTHGHQLSRQDKRRAADHLYRTLPGSDAERYADIAEMLGVTVRTAQDYCADARRDEQQLLRERVVLDWLDNPQDSNVTIAKRHGITDKTVQKWVSESSDTSEKSEPPKSRKHFDVWSFPVNDDQDTTWFGRMAPQIVENLLWGFTEPGHTVVDLFAGSGASIETARRMGRRIWASDRVSAKHYPLLPIRTHDVADGWPADAPRRADLILLDPPDWLQAAGRYSDHPEDMANMTLDGFLGVWGSLVQVCAAHLNDGGRVAYIAGPVQVGDLADGRMVDLAMLMLRGCWTAGLVVQRRVIVPFSTQKFSEQVTAAREHRKLLGLYQDLVVLRKDA